VGLSPSRRGFLRALGLTSLAAMPVFRAGIRQARADVPVVAKRFVGVKYCQGTRFAQWWPTGTGTEFPLAMLSPLLTPFERVKQKIIVPKGLKLSASLGPGGSHNAGMATFLTGIEVERNVGESASGGISLDQYLANKIGVGTRFASIVHAVKPFSTISFRGRLQPVAPVGDPLTLYKRLFAGLVDDLGNDLPSAEVERLRAKRKSILDHNAKEITAIEAQLGGLDRRRLHMHTESIRSVERIFADGQLCERPGPPAAADLSDLNNVPAVTRAHLDLLVLALSCGLTRVATFSFAGGAQGFSFPWLGISDGWHGMSHYGNSDVTGTEKYLKALTWVYEQIAYLLERMDGIIEADGGTLLDHSAVLVGTDNGQGNSHTINDIPFVLAGSAGGVFRTGRFIDYPSNTAHNGLLISIANAMGAPVETFGNPIYCNGPLPGLT
jgi:hypothetical protein